MLNTYKYNESQVLEEITNRRIEIKHPNPTDFRFEMTLCEN